MPDSPSDLPLHVTPRRGGVADYPPGATFGPRRLRDWEFVWIVSGDAEWECLGRRHPLPTGALALARPGMRDGFRWDQRRPTRHGFIHFDCTWSDPRLPARDDWPLVLDARAARPLITNLELALETFDQDHPLAASIAHQALRLAVLAFALGGSRDLDPALGAGLHPALQRMVERVLDALEHAATLEELAAAAGCSASHLHRLCSEAFGRSPQQLQRQLRLDRAAELLARSNLAVQEVATRCGFACPFHFSKTFARAYRCSPRAFRRRALAGDTVPTTPLLHNLRRMSGR